MITDTFKILKWTSMAVAASAIVFTLFNFHDFHFLQQFGCVITLLHLFALFMPFKGEVSSGLKNTLILSYVLFLGVSYYNGFFVNSADIQLFGYIILVYNLFAIVYRNGEFGPLYEKITLASLVSTIAVNFIHAMYPPTQGHPFFFNGSKEFLVIGSVLIMVFVAAYSLNKAKESREQILTQVKSLDWYGTLINLVSHNLRSPLATIMSNAQILELKHPELKDTKEFERTLTSVEATTTILNRLMKATLLNEGAVNQSIVQTLERSYPQVEFIGKSCEKLSYEESISILLALEVFIDNALKYSSDKVKVEFNHDGICIRDFGPGIDGEKLARFGDLQEHSVGTLHGMGIPFAARILDSIGYKIHASNENPGLQVILAKVE